MKKDKKHNTGEDNTGDWNTGNRNTGNRNTGYWNTGDSNTGDWNTGNRNTGYCNTGYWNTGDRNTGNSNTGDWNTGYWNTGDSNTGDWNTGNRNTGYCNTNTPFVRMFNQNTSLTYEQVSGMLPRFFYFDLTEWVQTEGMTEKEKEDYPTHETTGGYLKTIGYKEAWRASWNKANEEDKRKCLNLPNWNNELFEEISGINVEKELNTKVDDTKREELLAKVDELTKRIEELKAEAEKL